MTTVNTEPKEGRQRELGFVPEEAIQYLIEEDPALLPLISYTGPITLTVEAVGSPYESLAESIIYQQITGAAAATIFGRVRTRIGGGRFPKPEEILDSSEEALRGCGLSIQKQRAIRDLAEKAQAGVVPTDREIMVLPDEEIVQRLTTIRGVGRWTVEMLLIFRLGRGDVLPVADYGVRKGFMKTYRKRQMPTPGELMEYGERWRPFRTAASWYMWRALDAEKNEAKKSTP